jgi:hypothetical protein
MRRLRCQLISVGLFVCLIMTVTEASVVCPFPDEDRHHADSESVLAVSPATVGDGFPGDGRSRTARPAVRHRFYEARGGMVAGRVSRLRVRLSTMECPDDRPLTPTIEVLGLRHLCMGNSDSDPASPAV